MTKKNKIFIMFLDIKWEKKVKRFKYFQFQKIKFPYNLYMNNQIGYLYINSLFRQLSPKYFFTQAQRD